MIPPQLLCASFPVSSLATSSASFSFQPGDCYLFTRSCDYHFLYVFTLASPGFSPVICVFHFLSSAVCFLHLHLSLFYLQLLHASAPP